VKIAPPRPVGSKAPRDTVKKTSGAKWPSLRKLKEFALGRA
jgi:hypothetical protein